MCPLEIVFNFYFIFSFFDGKKSLERKTDTFSVLQV